MFNYFKIYNSKLNTGNNTYNLRVFFEMLPSVRNSIKINKFNKTIIDLNYSNTEIKTFNILIKKIFRFFSHDYKRKHNIIKQKKRI